MANPVSAGLTSREGRKFGLTVGSAFLLLALVFWWRDHELPRNAVTALGAVLIAAGVLVPRQLGPVQRGWLRFGHLLSRVTTPVILGVLYLFLITPIGWLMRSTRGNPIAHRAEDGSYWVRRPPLRGKHAMSRQF